jgi:hypothetical protein
MGWKSEAKKPKPSKDKIVRSKESYAPAGKESKIQKHTKRKSSAQRKASIKLETSLHGFSCKN